MARPPLPAPEGFEDAFVRLGWEAKDALGMRTSRFQRLVEASGDDLRKRRKNYVLGNRRGRGITSLKPASVVL